MKPRTVLAVVTAAAFLVGVPQAASPMRINVQKLDDIIEPYNGESDPWVPDGRDPGGMQPLTLQQHTVDDASGTAATTGTLERLWLRTVVQWLRVFGLGGVVR